MNRGMMVLAHAACCAGVRLGAMLEGTPLQATASTMRKSIGVVEVVDSTSTPIIRSDARLSRISTPKMAVDRTLFKGVLAFIQRVI